MAAPSVTHTFSNGTTADATEVNTNFSDIIAGITDGTKDLTISALTAQGAAVFNGATTLGNATGDDVTITGYVASDIVPKTTASSDLGSTSNTWSSLYLDTGATDGGAVYFNATSTSFLKSSADGLALNVEGFTSIDFPAALAFDMNGTEKVIVKNGSTNGTNILGRTDGNAVDATYIGEILEATDTTQRSASASNDTYIDLSSGMTKSITAGIWNMHISCLPQLIASGMNAGSLYTLYVAIYDTTNTTVIAEQLHYLEAKNATQFYSDKACLNVFSIENITSTTSYKAMFKYKFSGGTAETSPSFTIYCRNDTLDGYLRATRIG